MTPEEKEQFLSERLEAKQMKVMKNAFLDEFFRTKEQQLFELFKSTPIGSERDLANIHHQVKSLQALSAEVQTVMNSGKLADHSLQQELDKDKQ